MFTLASFTVTLKVLGDVCVCGWGFGCCVGRSHARWLIPFALNCCSPAVGAAWVIPLHDGEAAATGQRILGERMQNTFVLNEELAVGPHMLVVALAATQYEEIDMGHDYPEVGIVAGAMWAMWAMWVRARGVECTSSRLGAGCLALTAGCPGLTAGCPGLTAPTVKSGQSAVYNDNIQQPFSLLGQCADYTFYLDVVPLATRQNATVCATGMRLPGHLNSIRFQASKDVYHWAGDVFLPQQLRCVGKVVPVYGCPSALVPESRVVGVDFMCSSILSPPFPPFSFALSWAALDPMS